MIATSGGLNQQRTGVRRCLMIWHWCYVFSSEILIFAWFFCFALSSMLIMTIHYWMFDKVISILFRVCAYLMFWSSSNLLHIFNRWQICYLLLMNLCFNCTKFLLWHLLNLCLKLRPKNHAKSLPWDYQLLKALLMPFIFSHFFLACYFHSLFLHSYLLVVFRNLWPYTCFRSKGLVSLTLC